MSAYATPGTQPVIRVLADPHAQPDAVAPHTGITGLTRQEVMTAREVADLLRMPVSTVYELARRGELPARRLGRTWRFLRPRLEQLLSS
jgi:excisionase family DNA binding protein